MRFGLRTPESLGFSLEIPHFSLISGIFGPHVEEPLDDFGSLIFGLEVGLKVQNFQLRKLGFHEGFPQISQENIVNPVKIP